MKFFVVGLNHNSAPVELREQLAVKSSDLVSRARQVKRLEELDEIVLLSTCNRVEIYAAASGERGRTTRDFRSYTYVHDDLATANDLAGMPALRALPEGSDGLEAQRLEQPLPAPPAKRLLASGPRPQPGPRREERCRCRASSARSFSSARLTRFLAASSEVPSD